MDPLTIDSVRTDRACVRLDADDRTAFCLEVLPRVGKLVKVHNVHVLVRAVGAVRSEARRADWQMRTQSSQSA